MGSKTMSMYMKLSKDPAAFAASTTLRRFREAGGGGYTCVQQPRNTANSYARTVKDRLTVVHFNT